MTAADGWADTTGYCGSQPRLDVFSDGLPVAIPAQILAIAPAFSIGVGVLFGFYPAWRAARLDPIEALRHE